MSLQAIGVNQQSGGAFYPFVRPPSGYAWVLADLWLDYVSSYAPPRQPLRIQRLTGFGSAPAVRLSGINYEAADARGEAPVGAQESLVPRSIPHPYGLIITDDQGQLLLDTAEAETYREFPWGSQFQILEWSFLSQPWLVDSRWILRVVRYAAPRAADDYPANYASDVEFSPGIPLDIRTHQVLSRRLLTVVVEGPYGAALQSRPLVLSGGYNTELVVQPAEESGVTEIEINLKPGAGLGQYGKDFKTPCPRNETLVYGIDEAIYAGGILGINGVAPTPEGQFYLETDNCLAIELPTSAYEQPGAVLVGNALRVRDLCGQCAGCATFAAVYRAYWRLADQYRFIWDRIRSLRDEYHILRQRFLAQKACREKEILRISSTSICPCLAGFAVELINTTDDCLRNVVIPVSFQYSDQENSGITADSSPIDARLVSNSVFAGGFIDAATGRTVTREPFQLKGYWPNYTLHLPQINRYQTAFVIWQMLFPDCGEGQRVEAIADAYLPDEGSEIPHYALGAGPVGPAAYEIRLVSRPSKTSLALTNNCPETVEAPCRTPRRCQDISRLRVTLLGAMTSEPSLLWMNGTYILNLAEVTPEGCVWRYTSFGQNITATTTLLEGESSPGMVVTVQYLPGQLTVRLGARPVNLEAEWIRLDKFFERLGSFSVNQINLKRYFCTVYPEV